MSDYDIMSNYHRIRNNIYVARVSKHKKVHILDLSENTTFELPDTSIDRGTIDSIVEEAECMNIGTDDYIQVWQKVRKYRPDGSHDPIEECYKHVRRITTINRMLALRKTHY